MDYDVALSLEKMDCAEFRGSCAIVGLVGLVPPCLRGSENFSRGYFRGFKIFSRGYFVGFTFFLMCISWVSIFFSWVFRGSKILCFSVNFSKKQKETLLTNFN